MAVLHFSFVTAMSTCTTQAEVEPHLPADVEREIFELAAKIHLGGIPRLRLVVQRVKIWIEPISYRIFIVAMRAADTEPSPPRISPKRFLSARVLQPVN
ncbi:hypothetical protein C8R43DRAFT_358098 [Mycena crocata]|nr:hypothetical protein C8R43DRAFT_358098 [Mycena crocata]